MSHQVPTVSVVIPCFNHARYLPAAIASIRAQEHQPLEIVVVDDGSTDRSGDAASALGARVIRRAKGGVGAARNTGLAAARAELIVFLDADDELLPGAIGSGVSALSAHPDAACVIRCCEMMDAHGDPLPTTPPRVGSPDLYWEWLRGNCFAWTPGAAMFRRQHLAAIGGFPATLGPAADYAVYLALARSGAVRFDARDVVRYRRHDSNMSLDHALMLQTTLEVLRRERRHLPATHVAAFKAGHAAWRAFYGDHIVERLRASWRNRRWGRFELTQAWVLVRYCPAVVFNNLGRKLSVVARGATAERPRRRRVVPILGGTSDTGG